MTPSAFLAITLVLTAVAATVNGVLRHRHRSSLRRLAASWGMHYAADDRFHLSSRILGQLPIPGPADLEVKDLIYRSEGDGYRYFLTAEYTSGVVRSKKRRSLVCTFREPRERSHHPDDFTPLILADMEKPVEEQYRDLHSQVAGNALGITHQS